MTESTTPVANYRSPTDDELRQFASEYFGVSPWMAIHPGIIPFARAVLKRWYPQAKSN